METKRHEEAHKEMQHSIHCTSRRLPPRFRLVSLCAFLWPFLLALPAFAENWPRFRGPTGQGISSETNLPLKWSATENIAWKTPLTGDGWSSPVVWGDRIFLTATEEKGTSGRVICIDRVGGQLLWNKEVFTQKTYPIRQKNSFATPTPVTDGEHVYAVFGEGGIAALKFDGTVAWTNCDYPFHSLHGLGASPLLYKDLLIMPFDGSADPRKGLDKNLGFQAPWDGNFVVALNKKTGKEAWKTMRGPARLAHVTPIVIKVKQRDVLISNGGNVVQGFNPETGEKLWTVQSFGEGVTPSPVFTEGLIVACSGFGKPTLRAIRPDGSGDVTATHIAWEQTRALSMIPTVVPVKAHLYSVSDKGIAACLETKSGNVVWEERLTGAFCASPVFADGRIYLLSETGETTVIEPNPAEMKVLAKNSLNDGCQASMAVSQGQLFIRTKGALWCIGK